jgi:hypothetical protein
VNASLALCAAVLSALPAAEPSLTESVYGPEFSQQFAAVIRAQTPDSTLTTPVLTVPSAPGSTTMMYQPSGPAVSQGVPTYAPGLSGPAMGGPVQSMPYNTIPGADPYVYDPAYVPGGAIQEGRWGFYTGYDNVFLKPYFDHNAGTIDLNLGLGGTNQSASNMNWGFTYSPRVWIGLIEPNGTGSQVRFWSFDHGDVSGGGHQNLDMYVIDAEKVWHFHTCRGAVSVGAGIRYASIDERLVTSVNTGPLPGNGVITSDRDFNGFGPTLSISGRRRVNNTNWALFASARLSALYGKSSSAVIQNIPAVTGVTANYLNENDFIGVTDLQFGVDWSAPIWYQTKVFFRIAGEGQLWYNGGIPDPRPNGIGVPGGVNNGNMGLFGFTVGTGLVF